MKTSKLKACNYRFIIAISGDGQDLEDAVTKAGYKDALLSYRKGHTYLDFNRKAITFANAVQSAILDVEAAGLKVTAILGSEGGL